MLSSLPKPLQEAITVFLKSFKDSDLFVTHTAEEFLYGYNDPIFKFLNKLMPSVIPPQFGLFYQVCLERFAQVILKLKDFIVNETAVTTTKNLFSV